MKRIYILALCLLLIFSAAGCQPSDTPTTPTPMSTSSIDSGFVGTPRLDFGSYNGLNYLLWIPGKPADNMPLVVYLHNSNDRGSDPTQILLQGGFPRYLINGTFGNVNAYVLIPQLSTDHADWSAVQTNLTQLIDSTVEAYKLNSARVSLTGHSIGADAVWSLAIANPGKFSCIVPLSGSVTLDQQTLNALSSTPVWAIVGSNDSTAAENKALVQALEQYNPECYITVVEGASHAQVPDAYLNTQNSIIKWMLGH